MSGNRTAMSIEWEPLGIDVRIHLETLERLYREFECEDDVRDLLTSLAGFCADVDGLESELHRINE